ncbi:hypothetical protein GFC29_3076 [Anoxybacillus sp. B7M1]|nr:hypothetical protein GFC29_3076 [Anoxybacillus sp. B7M1]
MKNSQQNERAEKKENEMVYLKDLRFLRATNLMFIFAGM